MGQKKGNKGNDLDRQRKLQGKSKVNITRHKLSGKGKLGALIAKARKQGDDNQITNTILPKRKEIDRF